MSTMDRASFLRSVGVLAVAALVGPATLVSPRVAHAHPTRADLEHPEPREGITAELVLSVEALGKFADRPKIATLIYARGDPKNRKLTNADKNIKSLYNTYAHTGLPPTPIAGVSEASLRAAMNPAATDYLYYVVIDKQGNHAFASTLQEHEHNIEIARQNGVL